MGKALVVVESPAKAKTINKYLGPDFIVEASLGHVRDLPKKDVAVDVEGGFVPTYVVIDRKKEVIDRLKRLSKGCERIYMATDPDREGEAIAWHVAQEISDGSRPLFRVLFNEITQSGIRHAMAEPRQIDMNLVRAQEARRVMDRLIGYKVSPFLWKAFVGEGTKGLSAGRVQSVALRLIVEREKEINSFIPIAYWNLHGTFRTQKGDEFVAKLIEADGVRLVDPRGSAVGRSETESTIPESHRLPGTSEGNSSQEKTRSENGAFISSKEEAERLRERALAEEYRIEAVAKKEVRRKAPPPFTTSTLQQEANRHLRMKPKVAMGHAQQLYEGVELGTKGRVGLITYMRTDSVRVSDEAVQAATEWIYENYGAEYLPPERKEHKKAKGALVQDAHEAIRPADLKITPRHARKHLPKDLADLYELIYRRFIASQMADALFDQTTVDVRGGLFLFRATGRVTKFKGWTQVYDDDAERKETKEREGENEEEEPTLPEGLRKGAEVALEKMDVKRKETRPPPRFSESMLVKELESKGIGRPSTYAAIIATLLEREYVEDRSRRLHATELGIRVCDVLVQNFPSLFDVKFTARMEKDLDTIAVGTSTYEKVLQGFYRPLTTALKGARIERGGNGARGELGSGGLVRKTRAKEIARPATDEKRTCDKCASPMELRDGKYGPYWACLGFPACTRILPASTEATSIDAEATGVAARGTKRKATGEPVHAENAPPCDACGSPMVVRKGKNGDFLGCSAYPDCRSTRPIPLDLGCPRCGEGKIVERVGGRYRSTFYGCSRYPECRFTSSRKPVAGTCDKCGNGWLVEAFQAGEGERVECPQCGKRVE